MIHFFETEPGKFIAVGTTKNLSNSELDKLRWLFSGASVKNENYITGLFVGPRKEMITPWSTNAVEICQNCGISGIDRIEQFYAKSADTGFDPMLQQVYENPGQDIFTLDRSPEPIRAITDIRSYNETEGLALSDEEIEYLNNVSNEINRPLTDAEIFGFSQINSEHCRHKIFNGQFIIDGDKKGATLFQLIKKTSAKNPNLIVSAYKDNVAFIVGSQVEQFAPASHDKPDYFEIKPIDAVISLKAETHNFPTTVEPFNGAATGSGGEIRDRLAGGQGSFPLAGTAVYMTSYPRLADHDWEQNVPERKWLYQTPAEILIKASNGASDFGNKYGQPLICGSLVTFEHTENYEISGFDKVIMLAGGIGFAKAEHAKKKQVKPGEKIVVMGGDNYRIGMGGGAVSSVATGQFANAIELNAVQRSNPEMQKRVANVIRAMAELDENPIVSIHDHGAGGHLNCLSELVEETGGKIEISKLPIGDPTLSDKEILSNESQERMGLVIESKDEPYLKAVAERERAPYFQVGETTATHELIFENAKGEKPFHLKLQHLFGSSPVTILQDQKQAKTYKKASYEANQLITYLKQVLQLESVACKDWLTNKVDRSVSGKVATQQTTGQIQLPLNNVAVMALDFQSNKGIATSIGHAPVAALLDAAIGSKLAVTKALSNLVFAPLTHGLKGVSLSANWMWPAKNPGENARLYEAVEALSSFCCDLGINVPTGKDSLSMTQKYQDGAKVYAPGTVIVSSVAEVSDIRKTLSPAIQSNQAGIILYIPMTSSGFQLAGSAFGQAVSQIGGELPEIQADYIAKVFAAIQQIIEQNAAIAGHDVGAGGLITTLLEMQFATTSGTVTYDLSVLGDDLVAICFAENPAVILQITDDKAHDIIKEYGIVSHQIGVIKSTGYATEIHHKENIFTFNPDELRDTWMSKSHLLDKRQTAKESAQLRFKNYKRQPLTYQFPNGFDGQYKSLGIDPSRKNKSGIRAAIIREQGVNGDREMAYALWLSGFDVKDVHMTDLITGREDLTDVQMIVFVGGFSNSDVLGSAKGWAGSFRFNEKANSALSNFYKRPDTLSLGVCNGCQVMMELDKVYPEKVQHPKMKHNISGKFESAFVNVDILPNNTVMFGNMAGAQLGIWLAHGEGKFSFPESESSYQIPVKYTYKEFPGNPNGSDFGAAAVASFDGRHVAIMPHLERTIFPWNWAHYENKMVHQVSPWIVPFINAKNWLAKLEK